MCDGVDRQRDPVLDADFTHQLGDVGNCTGKDARAPKLIFLEYKKALAFTSALPNAGLVDPETYFAVTSECVMAWTDSAIRFWTPTLRISLATWALTVRSSMPNADPISL